MIKDYRISLLNSEGLKKTEVLPFPSKMDAVLSMKNQGLTVLDIKEIRKNAWFHSTVTVTRPRCDTVGSK